MNRAIKFVLQFLPKHNWREVHIGHSYMKARVLMKPKDWEIMMEDLEHLKELEWK